MPCFKRFCCFAQRFSHFGPLPAKGSGHGLPLTPQNHVVRMANEHIGTVFRKTLKTYKSNLPYTNNILQLSTNNKYFLFCKKGWILVDIAQNTANEFCIALSTVCHQMPTHVAISHKWPLMVQSRERRTRKTEKMQKSYRKHEQQTHRCGWRFCRSIDVAVVLNAWLIRCLRRFVGCFWIVLLWYLIFHRCCCKAFEVQ